MTFLRERMSRTIKRTGVRNVKEERKDWGERNIRNISFELDARI